MGVAAPLAALWIAGFQYPSISFTILFAVSYSRVVLKAHTVSQVIAGTVTGLVLTGVQLYLFFV